MQEHWELVRLEWGLLPAENSWRWAAVGIARLEVLSLAWVRMLHWGNHGFAVEGYRLKF